MFIHPHLNSSLLCEVASSAVRMFPLEYILVTATMVSSVTRIITGHSRKEFFQGNGNSKRNIQIWKYC